MVWSELFLKIRELVDKLDAYEPILIKGCRTKKVLFDSIQILLEKGLPCLFKDHEMHYFKLPSGCPFHENHQNQTIKTIMQA